MTNDNIEMGKPMVLIPYWSQFKGDNNYNTSPACPPPQSPEEFQWYLVPLSYSEISAIVMQPAQNFHPFLLWVGQPGAKTSTTDDTATYTPSKTTRGDTIEQPFPSDPLEFFILQHVTSGVYASSTDKGLQLERLTSEDVSRFQKNDCSKVVCLPGTIQAHDSASGVNNMFAFWFWNQQDTAYCNETSYKNSHHPFPNEGCDISKNDPQYNKRCTGVMSSPYYNGSHNKLNAIYLGKGSDWAPSNEMKLHDQSGFSKINVMGVGSDAIDDPTLFWKQYGQGQSVSELWPVPYPSSDSPYYRDRSKSFVVPIQYGIVKDTTLSGKLLEAYAWVGSNWDRWQGLGVLSDSSFDNDLLISTTSAPKKITITGSMVSGPVCADKNIDSDGDKSSQCCQAGTVEWTAEIQDDSGKYLRMGDQMPGSDNIHYADFRTGGIKCNATKNGHIHCGNFYLCVLSDEDSVDYNRVVFVDFEAELDNPGNIQFECPMWSIVQQF